jgi:hypothetical protein
MIQLNRCGYCILTTLRDRFGEERVTMDPVMQETGTIGHRVCVDGFYIATVQSGDLHKCSCGWEDKNPSGKRE